MPLPVQITTIRINELRSMDFLLWNPVTAVKRVLSKKLGLYLEANKFPLSGDCTNKNGMLKFLELHQTKVSHFIKN
jgi:hypothetical protein